MHADEATEIANITVDLAQVHVSLDLCVGLLGGIMQRLALISVKYPTVVQDVSGQVFESED